MKRITLTAIVAGLTALGGMVAYSVDWAIKTQDRLGVSQARYDSLFAFDSLANARLNKVERVLGIKNKRGVVPRPQKREGIIKQILGIFW